MMSAIGDAVHTLPVITALKRHAPGTRISWVLQPGPAALMRGHPDVDEIVLFDKARGWRAYAETRRQLRDPFDLVLSLQVAIKGGLVTAMTRAPVKLGFDRARARDLNWLFTTHRIPPHPPQHVQDQLFEFLAALGVPHQPVTWNLGPWPHEREAQRAKLAAFERPIVVLVIGTSHPQKEWIPERWARIVDALDERGLEPVIATGRSPRELDTEAIIAARARRTPCTVHGLRETVALIDGAALVVSLDTAPLHMAVALGRPVVSLIGYTNPASVGPYRASQDLIVDAYGEPGERNPITTGHRRGRMARIQVADVLAKVDAWRARHSGAARPGSA
jgi:heptosyltransferase I